jgi:hypothetical protein
MINSVMNMIELRGGKGLFAIVDEDDYEELSKHAWRKMRIYAYRDGKTADEPKTVFMHRHVMGLLARQKDKRIVVDHLNGNGLDNRRENLRICTQRENLGRQGPRKNGGRFKGVSKLPYGRWLARFETTYLGCFATEEDAARRVDEAAVAAGKTHWLNLEKIVVNKSCLT